MSSLSAIRSASVRTAMTVVTVPVAAGSLCLILAPCASASAVMGTAVLALPGATASSPLPSGGSSTPFTVALPPRAACPGDTAHDGYRVYSYLIPKGTDLSSVTFVDVPSTGYGLIAGGRYYGAINTAIHTGQIIGIPNDFEWGALVSPDRGPVALSALLDGPSHGVWETGLACADSKGTLTNAWNTQVTFVARPGDAGGFGWITVPGAPDSPAGGAGTAGGGSTVPVSAQTHDTVATAATTPERAHTSHSSTGSGGKGGTVHGSPGPEPVGGNAATDDAPIDIALALGALVLLIGVAVLVGRVVQAGRTGSSGTGR